MKALRTSSVIAVLVFLLCSPATAAITEPIITATVADTDTMTLLIEGMNLPKSAVYMGRDGGGVLRLNVTSATPTTIEAELQTVIPGTYIVALVVSAELRSSSRRLINRPGLMPAGDAAGGIRPFSWKSSYLTSRG